RGKSVVNGEVILLERCVIKPTHHEIDPAVLPIAGQPQLFRKLVIFGFAANVQTSKGERASAGIYNLGIRVRRNRGYCETRDNVIISAQDSQSCVSNIVVAAVSKNCARRIGSKRGRVI